MTSERVRGVAVRTLDMKPLENEATEWVTTKRLDLVDNGLTRLGVGFAPWGTFEDALGNTVIVCHEGVGYLVLPDEPAKVALYAEYGKGGTDKTISMMPMFEAPITKDYIQENLTGETIDLADFVRSFGQRLEGNFHDLYRLATNVGAAQEAVDEWVSESS